MTAVKEEIVDSELTEIKQDDTTFISENFQIDFLRDKSSQKLLACYDSSISDISQPFTALDESLMKGYE